MASKRAVFGPHRPLRDGLHVECRAIVFVMKANGAVHFQYTNTPRDGAADGESKPKRRIGSVSAAQIRDLARPAGLSDSDYDDLRTAAVAAVVADSLRKKHGGGGTLSSPAAAAVEETKSETPTPSASAPSASSANTPIADAESSSLIPETTQPQPAAPDRQDVSRNVERGDGETATSDSTVRRSQRSECVPRTIPPKWLWSRAMDNATAPPSFLNYFYAARAARACLLLPSEHMSRRGFDAFLSTRGRVFWRPWSLLVILFRLQPSSAAFLCVFCVNGAVFVLQDIFGPLLGIFTLSPDRRQNKKSQFPWPRRGHQTGEMSAASQPQRPHRK